MTDRERYLDLLHRNALAAGLDMHTPGLNWVRQPSFRPGHHFSVSVRARLIQVNLCNDDDADRAAYEFLYSRRSEAEQAIGCGLIWEKKDGRRKTAVRAQLDQGYEDGDWPAQHAWAIDQLKRFQAVFPRILADLH